MTGTSVRPGSVESTREASREDVVGRLFGALVGAMELSTVYVGQRTGLYAALRDRPATAQELASRADVAGRYAREWLEQQASAGLVSVDDAEASPSVRRYRLDPAVAEVLLDEASEWYAGAAPRLAVGLARATPAVPPAYRTGDGVGYAEYGADVRQGIAAFNRTMIDHLLIAGLPALADINERLGSGPARMLDLGCGTGHSSIAFARAYPALTVRGIDLDPASIAEARAAAADAGVADRVAFSVGDGAEVDAHAGTYELVTIVNALHDMADPVGGLRTARAALAPGASVLMVDDRCAEHFTAPGDDQERFVYAFSALHCLPATMAEGPVIANGAIVRPSTVRAWAGQAGLSIVEEVAALSDDAWRCYRLRA